MKYFVIHTILFGFLLVSCASQPAIAQSGDEPVFNVITKNQNDQIDIQHNGVTTIDIHSPAGIGFAKFELEAGSMPDSMALRLHLKGLEEFRLVSDQTTVSASASSGQVFNASSQQVTTSGNQYSITPIDPLWMPIEIVSNQTVKKIPLEEGFFEILVPKEFIHSAGNSFEVQWIDFYR
jgi:hypothetical protein